MATYKLEKKTDAELKEITDEVVHRVLDNDKLKVDKIILYGSYARGDADDESDIDIMILCDNSRDTVRENERVLWKCVDDIGYDHDVFIQTVVEEQAFFNEWIEDLPFFRNVNNEGVVLYE